MISIKRLLPFSFPVLLTGCAVPCAQPDLLASDPAPSCFYQLRITSVDTNKYLARGKLPDTVHKKNDKEKTFSTSSSKHLGKEFTFRVLDLDKLGNQVVQGRTYEFIRLSNSAYLELMTGGPID